MQHFLEKLEHSISMWPDNVEWSLIQLASYTRQDSEDLCKFFADALAKPFTDKSRLNRDQAIEALSLFKAKEVATQVKVKEHQEKLFKTAMKKAADLESNQQYDRGFQNLSYLLGENAQELSQTSHAALVNECLRLGFKARRNIQELDTIIRSFCERARKTRRAEAVDEALDMLDAFKGQFIQSSKGEQLFIALTKMLQEPQCK